MAFSIGIEGPVCDGSLDAFHFAHRFKTVFRYVVFGETFPNVIYRGLTWMQHILGIKAVVTEFIHHDFVAWKIVCSLLFMAYSLMERSYDMRFAL